VDTKWYTRVGCIPFSVESHSETLFIIVVPVCCAVESYAVCRHLWLQRFWLLLMLVVSHLVTFVRLNAHFIGASVVRALRIHVKAVPAIVSSECCHWLHGCKGLVQCCWNCWHIVITCSLLFTSNGIRTSLVILEGRILLWFSVQ